MVWLFSEETENEYYQLLAKLRSDILQEDEASRGRAIPYAITRFMGVSKPRGVLARASGYMDRYENLGIAPLAVATLKLVRKHFEKEAKIVLAARGWTERVEYIHEDLLSAVLQAITTQYPQMKDYFEDFRGGSKPSTNDAHTAAGQVS